jgi:hypothetical protein
VNFLCQGSGHSKSLSDFPEATAVSDSVGATSQALTSPMASSVSSPIPLALLLSTVGIKPWPMPPGLYGIAIF